MNELPHLKANWLIGMKEKSKKPSLCKTPLPDYMRALFANGREHMEVDLRFLRYLREMIPSAPRLPLIPADTISILHLRLQRRKKYEKSA